MLVKQLRGTAATPASVGTDATMAADASTLIGSKRALALQAHPNPVAASAPDVRALINGKRASALQQYPNQVMATTGTPAAGSTAAATPEAFVQAILQIGRAHVWTPVTNAQLVCRLLLEKK